MNFPTLLPFCGAIIDPNGSKSLRTVDSLLKWGQNGAGIREYGTKEKMDCGNTVPPMTVHPAPYGLHGPPSHLVGTKLMAEVQVSTGTGTVCILQVTHCAALVHPSWPTSKWPPADGHQQILRHQQMVSGR